MRSLIRSGHREEAATQRASNGFFNSYRAHDNENRHEKFGARRQRIFARTRPPGQRTSGVPRTQSRQADGGLRPPWRKTLLLVRKIFSAVPWGRFFQLA